MIIVNFNTDAHANRFFFFSSTKNLDVLSYLKLGILS